MGYKIVRNIESVKLHINSFGPNIPAFKKFERIGENKYVLFDKSDVELNYLCVYDPCCDIFLSKNRLKIYRTKFDYLCNIANFVERIALDEGEKASEHVYSEIWFSMQKAYNEDRIKNKSLRWQDDPFKYGRPVFYELTANKKYFEAEVDKIINSVERKFDTVDYDRYKFQVYPFTGEEVSYVSKILCSRLSLTSGRNHIGPYLYKNGIDIDDVHYLTAVFKKMGIVCRSMKLEFERSVDYRSEFFLHNKPAKEAKIRCECCMRLVKAHKMRAVKIYSTKQMLRDEDLAARHTWIGGKMRHSRTDIVKNDTNLYYPNNSANLMNLCPMCRFIKGNKSFPYNIIFPITSDGFNGYMFHLILFIVLFVLYNKYRLDIKAVIMPPANHLHDVLHAFLHTHIPL